MVDVNPSFSFQNSLLFVLFAGARGDSHGVVMVIDQIIVKTLKWVFIVMESIFDSFLLCQYFFDLDGSIKAGLFWLFKAGDWNYFPTWAVEVKGVIFVFRCFKLVLRRSIRFFFVMNIIWDHLISENQVSILVIFIFWAVDESCGFKISLALCVISWRTQLMNNFEVEEWLLIRLLEILVELVETSFWFINGLNGFIFCIINWNSCFHFFSRVHIFSY